MRVVVRQGFYCSRLILVLCLMISRDVKPTVCDLEINCIVYHTTWWRQTKMADPQLYCLIDIYVCSGTMFGQVSGQ